MYLNLSLRLDVSLRNFYIQHIGAHFGQFEHRRMKLFLAEPFPKNDEPIPISYFKLSLGQMDDLSLIHILTLPTIYSV